MASKALEKPDFEPFALLTHLPRACACPQSLNPLGLFHFQDMYTPGRSGFILPRYYLVREPVCQPLGHYYRILGVFCFVVLTYNFIVLP